MKHAIENFKAAMQDAGITAPEFIIGDGGLHRFKIDGKLNGAYVLHLDGRPAGYFQDFKQGIKQTWKQSGSFIPLSEYQRQAFAKQRQEDAVKRQNDEAFKQCEAAKKARYVWNNVKPANANHPYLLKKRIGSHGARIGRDNTLIIPLFNAKNELVNLQFISETGTKRFLSGGKKQGCFYCIGDTITERVLISEGFATGASLHEDSGYLTFVAFDAGNLKEVSIVVKSICPDREIVICGDNDISGNGQSKAIEAARAICGKYLLPPIAGTDWNDIISMEVAL